MVYLRHVSENTSLYLNEALLLMTDLHDLLHCGEDGVTQAL